MFMHFKIIVIPTIIKRFNKNMKTTETWFGFHQLSTIAL